ncbi:DUF58 domain-containing protein [Sphingoaurantiacus capsulatus]|uniref:DUF58 domain-containing protein n=1 Tax=Sphingoaurantiacus capsulatus TaxID=1771310 RepID=A0ABV7X9A9_9SPHN
MSLDAAASAAAGLGQLSLNRARARAAGFHGGHARRTAGPGSEFWQYRELQPGEAIDRVDWRRSGRSDHLYVREREREDPVRLWLWVDGTASMDFASRDGAPTKLDHARLIAAAIGLAAVAAGERIGDLARPGANSKPDSLFASIVSSEAQLPAGAMRAGDVVLLVGDFLDGPPLDWVEAAAAAGAVGTLVAVADPAEVDFPFAGRTHFEGVEPGDAEQEFARAENVRADYLAAWAAHLARLDAIGKVTGWTSFMHRTDHAPDAALATVAGWLRG